MSEVTHLGTFRLRERVASGVSSAKLARIKLVHIKLAHIELAHIKLAHVREVVALLTSEV